MDSVAVAPGLWSTGSIVVSMGFVAPLYVSSSQIKYRTHVSYLGRPVLYL